MKTKQYLHLPILLLILGCVSVFGITVSADAQEVHALLIILGNDRDIKESVEKNEEKMVNMLKQLSHHCNVRLTVMKSKSALEGELTQTTFANGTSGSPNITGQGIIQSRQVAEWLENLKPKSEDTIFVYYNGHGQIGAFDTHNLLFDPGVSADALDRGKLSDNLNQKPAHLRMLITDTCSNLSEDLSDNTFARYSIGVRAKARSYLQDLFLEHEGFLDITAASPGQSAIANSDLGGHFTSALLSQGFTAAAESTTDQDTFLSWQEAFDETVTATKQLYGEATFSPTMQRDLRNQTTQEPYKHSLPMPIAGNTAPGEPSIIEISTTATLNVISTPSGATVYVDGTRVGTTPLRRHEVDTGVRGEKRVKIGLELTGYKSRLADMTLVGGENTPWNVRLES